MLARMNFPTQTISLIHACITPPTFSVQINGVPQGYIPSARGTRQGDLLPPFLFCIAIKYMSMQLVATTRNKQTIPDNNVRPIVSYLLYADDVMFFASADTKSAITIKDITNSLSGVVGLTLNQMKTKIYFGSNC